jgi:hypothetical protein
MPSLRRQEMELRSLEMCLEGVAGQDSAQVAGLITFLKEVRLDAHVMQFLR